MKNKLLDKIRIVIVNLLNNSIIRIQLLLKPVSLMKAEDLTTENRLDINLRVEFLKQVINKGKKAEKTRYYKFVQVFDSLDPDLITKKFLGLYDDIKKNSFKKYLVVARVNKFNNMEGVFRSHREVSNKKIMSEWQLVGGAHRLAACRFLGHEKIPVKIVSSPFLDFPDFTSFIKRYKI
jgi:hypothetical protein